MKVWELIDLLRRCDPDLDVRIAWKEDRRPLQRDLPAQLDEVASVGTDNAPPRPAVLLSNWATPSLVLPHPTAR